MVPFSFPPQRGMVKRENYVVPAYPEYIDFRSQDLETIYHDCGQFYWCKTGEFRKNRNMLCNKTVPYIVSEMEVQDIDNESDWKLAEIKYKYMHAKEIEE
jgi:N-acylneuraminate cytidylyltransferase